MLEFFPSKKFFRQKSKKKISKHFFVKKKFWQKKNWRKFSSAKFFFRQIFSVDNFLQQNFFSANFFAEKFFFFGNIFLWRNFLANFFLCLNFCCVNSCWKFFFSKILFKMVQGIYLWSLVQIRPVTAEILLIVSVLVCGLQSFSGKPQLWLRLVQVELKLCLGFDNKVICHLRWYAT